MEGCRLHSNEWVELRSNLTEAQCLLEDLEPGETYGFRVVCRSGGDSGPAGPPSQPLSVPMPTDRVSSGPLKDGLHSSTQDLDSLWQRDFDRRYIELEELGRGRACVVRRCQEILSGDEVAVKFVNRRRQGRERTRREYELMRRLHHPNVARAAGLFLTATSDAIVMKL